MTRDRVSITLCSGHVVADTSGTNGFGGIGTLFEVLGDVSFLRRIGGLYFCGGCKLKEAVILLMSLVNVDDSPY